MFITFGDTVANRPIALLLASLVATVVTLPFDNIKTRMQIAFPKAEMNRINYTSFRDVIVKASFIEGYKWWLVGFYAYYIKVYAYAAVTLFSMDLITHRWKVQAKVKPEYM